MRTAVVILAILASAQCINWKWQYCEGDKGQTLQIDSLDLDSVPARGKKDQMTVKGTCNATFTQHNYKLDVVVKGNAIFTQKLDDTAFNCIKGQPFHNSISIKLPIIIPNVLNFLSFDLLEQFQYNSLN